MSNTAKTLAERAAADPTDLHERFALWIEEKTGVKPDTKTVQLACIFRGEFQASDENQQALKSRKSAAAAKAAKVKADKIAKAKKLLAELEAEEATSMPAETKSTPEPKPETKKTPVRKPRVRKAVAAPKTTPDVSEDFDADDLTDANNAKPAPRRRTRRTAATKTA